ncbi:MAG: DUF3467 domain-containing protein [Calditrichaeota bacterium]|nr:DUF3467 domain-containing protein [Calditrichota bacterium]
MNQQPPPQQIQVQIDEKTGQGIYANLALISHSGAEFVVDFTRMLPGMPKAIVQARIILTPQHTKSLLKALEENLKRYEERYGEIKTGVEKHEGGRNFGFQAGTEET